jgi:hypothetical protein
MAEEAGIGGKQEKKKKKERRCIRMCRWRERGGEEEDDVTETRNEGMETKEKTEETEEDATIALTAAAAAAAAASTGCSLTVKQGMESNSSDAVFSSFCSPNHNSGVT